MSERDELLLERLRGGDAAAFELLFTQHYGQVYRVAYNLVGTREAAEDLAQETFLALYREPPPAGAPLLAWLGVSDIRREDAATGLAWAAL